MAALAYALPPVTGLVAYLGAASPRTRWHGLQAIVLGVVWPLALYAGTLVSPGVTQAAGALGGLTWAAFIAGAAAGRDPSWPVIGRALRALAEAAPRAGVTEPRR